MDNGAKEYGLGDTAASAPEFSDKELEAERTNRLPTR